MKIRRVILAVFTVIFITLLLSLSTGFTIIFHACNTCDEFSLKTELFEDHQHSFEDCCCKKLAHDDHNNGISFTENCCNTTVEKLKITNYIPVNKFKICSSSFIIPEIKAVSQPVFLCESPFISYKSIERYGGRQIVTAFRQILI